MKLRREPEDGQYFLDVTDFVRPTVGRLLKKAEIEIDSYHSPEEARDIAKRLLQTYASRRNRGSGFDCDAGTLHLYLKDQDDVREIVFYNSEWGGIYSKGTAACTEEGRTSTLSSLSDDRLRQVFLSLKACAEDTIDPDRETLTMAYLAHPGDDAAAVPLFLADVEQEILDRFLYLY